MQGSDGDLKEKRFLVNTKDDRRNERLIGRLRMEMGSAANISYVVRALLEVLASSEKEVLSEVAKWEWERPRNGDHRAMNAHVADLASLFHQSFKKSRVK